jgi:hypothetical protein
MWFLTGGFSPVTWKLRETIWQQNIKHELLLFYSKCDKTLQRKQTSTLTQRALCKRIEKARIL